MHTQGLVIFRDMTLALRAGYQRYDKTADGYLLRIKTPKGWAFALYVGTK